MCVLALGVSEHPQTCCSRWPPSSSPFGEKGRAQTNVLTHRPGERQEADPAPHPGWCMCVCVCVWCVCVVYVCVCGVCVVCVCGVCVWCMCVCGCMCVSVHTRVTDT